jgi:hypothetical protein
MISLAVFPDGCGMSASLMWVMKTLSPSRGFLWNQRGLSCYVARHRPMTDFSATTSEESVLSS